VLWGQLLPKGRKWNYETKNYLLFIDEQLLLNTADELFCPINPASSFYPDWYLNEVEMIQTCPFSIFSIHTC
jgi:hypothetical protein